MRKGDPISPLIFVMVMEYLSRTLRIIGDLPDFRYHYKCKDMKMNHLIFADDLMIVGKAHGPSIDRVLEGLKYFHEVSGLQINEDKSSIYISGVDAGR